MKKLSWVAMLPFYLLTAIGFIGVANWFSFARTTSVQSQSVKREHTVIIDAGHGGIDGGATSCTGVLESKINLEIALKLDALFQLLGVETKMIRTTDTSVYTQGNTIAAQKVSDLKERIRIINETENGIFISIHQNTFSNSRYSGAQVFYGQSPGSKELAQELQGALVSAVNQGSKRVCKPGNEVYILQNSNKCGVLIECGFLSNPQEEANLRNQEYQKHLCCVIATGLMSYIGQGSVH